MAKRMMAKTASQPTQLRQIAKAHLLLSVDKSPLNVACNSMAMNQPTMGAASLTARLRLSRAMAMPMPEPANAA